MASPEGAADSVTEEQSRIASQTLLYAASLGLIALRELIILPLFARLLGREAYGLFAQLIVVVMLLIPFVTFQLQVSTVRFLAQEDSRQALREGFFSGLFWVSGSTVVAATVIGANPGMSARLILGEAGLEQYIPPAALLLVATSLAAYLQSFFRVVRRIDQLAYLLFGQTGLEIGAILVLVNNGYGIRGALWGLIGTRVAVSMGILAVVWRRLGRPTVAWQRLKPLLIYGLPLMPNSIMRSLINYADRLVIIQVLGLAAVGVYAASYALGQVLYLLVMPLGFVLFPFLSRLWDRGQRDEVRSYMSHATRYFLLAAMPVSVGISLLSQPLLRLIATADFETTEMLVFWIALGFVLSGVFQINAYAFHLAHRTRSLSLILVASAILNIGLNVVLVPALGLLGAAIATTASFALMAVVAFAFGRRLIGFGIRWLDLGKSALAVGAMVIVIRSLPTPAGWMGLLGVIALSAGVYLICLVGSRAVSMVELTRLWLLVFVPSMDFVREPRPPSDLGS